MSAAAIAPSPRYRVAPFPVRRFSVAEYERLIREGFFVADEQFELLDGYITEKMSRNPPHDAALNRARRAIERALAGGWIVRVQSAITTADSQPEPDIAIARGEDLDYVTHHPYPTELALVVEVANTSLAADRGLKLASYARAGINAYWIVNLDDQQLEVYARPDRAQATFTQQQILKRGESVGITLDTAASAMMRVDDLLP